MTDPLTCLALVIYFEARGEPLDGQAAVAGVVLERVASSRYPDTICDVSFQRRQFSAFNSGVPPIRDQQAWGVSQAVAQAVLDDPEGTVPILGASHYHADWVSPSWANNLQFLGQIGVHLFYGSLD